MRRRWTVGAEPQQDVGEYTIGTDLHRSESLALVQLLILYHLVTAKATIALGGVGLRADAVAAAEVGTRGGGGGVVTT
jgi:hypothetical protein